MVDDLRAGSGAGCGQESPRRADRASAAGAVSDGQLAGTRADCAMSGGPSPLDSAVCGDEAVGRSAWEANRTGSASVDGRPTQASSSPGEAPPESASAPPPPPGAPDDASARPTSGSARRVTVYTIGYAGRTQEALFELLASRGVRRLADVRRVPSSMGRPEFSERGLRAECRRRGIRYDSCGQGLGGKRAEEDFVAENESGIGSGAGAGAGAAPDAPGAPSPDYSGLSIAPQRAYARYCASPVFLRALCRFLTRSAAAGPVAVLCAEVEPWRCHRAVLCDALQASGARVRHVISRHLELDHRPCGRGAALWNGRVLCYPARRGGKAQGGDEVSFLGSEGGALQALWQRAGGKRARGENEPPPSPPPAQSPPKTGSGDLRAIFAKRRKTHPFAPPDAAPTLDPDPSPPSAPAAAPVSSPLARLFARSPGAARDSRAWTELAGSQPWSGDGVPAPPVARPRPGRARARSGR